jgi:hypothetical protein
MSAWVLLCAAFTGAGTFASRQEVGDEFTPGCRVDQPGYAAVRFEGEVSEGREFERSFGPGFRFVLEPIEAGWSIAVYARGREDDLSRLTPPWHFVPNPCSIEGWHFRNAANTGPNDGSVNAPQEERWFVFSPEVGLTIDGPQSTSIPTEEEMLVVAGFGAGEFRLVEYRLADLDRNQRARMVWLRFSVCISWSERLPDGKPR